MGGIAGGAAVRRSGGILALSLALAIPLGLAGGAAWGQDSSGQAQSIPADPDRAAALAGIGVLSVGDRQSCTAVLIAPDQALTAAHCVVGQAVAEVQLHFGTAGPHGLTGVTIDPAYRPDAVISALADLAPDMALLSLARPVPPDEALPLAVTDWPDPIDSFVDILGFERDGPPGLRLREACMALQADGGVAVVNCPVVAGLSGAAVLLQTRPGDAPALVATVSSLGQGRAYVVQITPRLAALRAAAVEPGGQP